MKWASSTRNRVHLIGPENKFAFASAKTVRLCDLHHCDCSVCARLEREGAKPLPPRRTAPGANEASVNGVDQRRIAIGVRPSEPKPAFDANLRLLGRAMWYGELCTPLPRTARRRQRDARASVAASAARFYQGECTNFARRPLERCPLMKTSGSVISTGLHGTAMVPWITLPEYDPAAGPGGVCRKHFHRVSPSKIAANPSHVARRGPNRSRMDNNCSATPAASNATAPRAWATAHRFRASPTRADCRFVRSISPAAYSGAARVSKIYFSPFGPGWTAPRCLRTRTPSASIRPGPSPLTSAA